MGWFWASDLSTPSPPSSTIKTSSPTSQSRCPIDHSARSSSQECPRHGGTWRALNPRNNMPDLPNTPSQHTNVALPTAREMSSIPMNTQGERWEYPSPQQMLNAMTRKGYETSNPEDVPAMVAVHNWINEGSWTEILKWEKKYFPENQEPHLVKFSGRPDRPTPKSSILYKLGRSPKAFDHHEWFVSTPDGRTRRYVIDYYAVDELTFSIDVRPALDDLPSIKARTMKFAENMKSKVTGNDGNDE